MPERPLPFVIRRYHPDDREAVANLFVRVNRSLAPPALEAAFEDYVARSPAEDIGRIDTDCAEYLQPAATGSGALSVGRL